MRTDEGAAPPDGREARIGQPPRTPIPRVIRVGRIVAIGRGLPPSRVLPIGDALSRGGLRAFEITLNTEDALSAISRLARRFGHEELLVGAGTVLDRASAEKAVSAGACFLVMPHTDAEIVRWAAEREVPVFPGAFTPSEILAAWRAGATAVKPFPASAAGPAFVREIRGPLPDIPLIPTGGVTIENASAFLAAGAVAVGLGSWLMGDGYPEGIERRAAEAVAVAVAALSVPSATQSIAGAP